MPNEERILVKIQTSALPCELATRDFRLAIAPEAAGQCSLLTGPGPLRMVGAFSTAETKRSAKSDKLIGRRALAATEAHQHAAREIDLEIKENASCRYCCTTRAPR